MMGSSAGKKKLSEIERHEFENYVFSVELTRNYFMEMMIIKCTEYLA